MIRAYCHHYVNAPTCNLATHLYPPISLIIQFGASDGCSGTQDLQDRSHVDPSLQHSILKMRFAHADI